MSNREMPVEEARKRLGDLVIAAMGGESTILTRYGRPAAMLVPYTEEPAMTVTATDLRTQVVRFLEAGDHGDDYDVDGIVEAIHDQHGHVNLDSIDAADFNAILAANDTTVTTYRRDDDEGTEEIVITRTGDEIRETYSLDGSVTDPESYLRDRAVDLTADGYREV